MRARVDDLASLGLNRSDLTGPRAPSAREGKTPPPGAMRKLCLVSGCAGRGRGWWDPRAVRPMRPATRRPLRGTKLSGSMAYYSPTASYPRDPSPAAATVQGAWLRPNHGDIRSALPRRALCFPSPPVFRLQLKGPPPTSLAETHPRGLCSTHAPIESPPRGGELWTRDHQNDRVPAFNLPSSLQT